MARTLRLASPAHTALLTVDSLIVQGAYQVKPPLPFTPGNCFVGTVSAVGDGVDDASKAISPSCSV